MKITERRILIKKYIETKLGIYRYTNDDELEQIVETMLTFINKVANNYPRSRILLERENNTVRISQYINNKYEPKMNIHLLEEFDFFKFYDLLDEKLNLKIGLHHSYGHNMPSWTHYVTIFGILVDLISDNTVDQNWMNYYFNNSSTLERTNEDSVLKLQKIIKK